MSTSNILSIEPEFEMFGEFPVPTAVVVSFQTHGQGVRSYRYTGVAAQRILAGDDPAEYSGTPV